MTEQTPHTGQAVADAADDGHAPEVRPAGDGQDPDVRPAEVGTATVTAGTSDPIGDGPDGNVGLDRLGQVPLVDHPAIFERIHADLQAALADIDGA